MLEIILVQGFCPLKIKITHSLMDFALMFLGDKSDIHLDLTKYNVAAMNALLKFEIPAA